MAEILIPKILHGGDRIALTRDSDNNYISDIFYMAAEDTSFEITSGSSANLVVQANNDSLTSTSFSSNWVGIYTVPGDNFEIINKPYRFIRLFNSTSADIGSTFECLVFNRLCGPYVE